MHTWGDNNHGQLGDGTTTFRPTPVAVVSLGSGSRIIAVFTGGGSTFAVVAGPNTQAPTGAPQSGSPAAKAVTGNPRTAG